MRVKLEAYIKSMSIKVKNHLVMYIFIKEKAYNANRTIQAKDGDIKNRRLNIIT